MRTLHELQRAYNHLLAMIEEGAEWSDAEFKVAQLFDLTELEREQLFRWYDENRLKF